MNKTLYHYRETSRTMLCNEVRIEDVSENRNKDLKKIQINQQNILGMNQTISNTNSGPIY